MVGATSSFLDALPQMQSLFAQFDASRAKCFKPKDRQHLLAVIESGFGDLLPFNKCIRALMADAAVAEAVRPEDLDNSDVVKEAEAAIVAAEKTARSEVAAASQHEIAEREKLGAWKHNQRTER